MPRKRLTREEKRAATRNEILDAAERIFPRRGYHQASVEEIAEEAGLSTGAVYSNFDSKADLCLALYERHVERHAQELEEMVARGDTPEAQIEGGAQHWREFMRRDREWLLLDMEFWAFAARYPDLRERYAAAYRGMRAAVVRLVERAAETFGLSLPASPQELGVIMNALSMGFMFEKLMDPEGVPDEAYDSALRLILMAPASDEAPPCPEAEAEEEPQAGEAAGASTQPSGG